MHTNSQIASMNGDPPHRPAVRVLVALGRMYARLFHQLRRAHAMQLAAHGAGDSGLQSHEQRRSGPDPIRLSALSRLDDGAEYYERAR